MVQGGSGEGECAGVQQVQRCMVMWACTFYSCLCSLQVLLHLLRAEGLGLEQQFSVVLHCRSIKSITGMRSV